MSHPQTERFLESWKEAQEEDQSIKEACDADLYTIHKNHLGEELARQITIETLKARIATRLTTFLNACEAFKEQDNSKLPF